MSKFWDLVDHLKDQIVKPPNRVVISDSQKLVIRCECGVETELSTRALTRKYHNRDRYLCKSCNVKEYVSDETRLAKWRASYQKTLQDDPTVRQKLAVNGAKSWEQPGFREKMNIARRKNTPAQQAARKKALAALQSKAWYPEHMAKMRHAQDGKRSILELIVDNVLKEMSIKYTPQYKLGYYSFDFLLPDFNLLLEVQGEYWHQDSIPKDSAKATYAVQQGYQVKHIWEHEFSQHGRIKQIIREFVTEDFQPIEYEFSQLRVQEITVQEARIFYGMYHYLPSISKFGRHFGAFFNDQLICAVTFSQVTRKESYERLNLKKSELKELSRFCIAPKFQRKNLASWFMAKSIKWIKSQDPTIKCLISFADTTLGHTGVIYQASNWAFDGETKPSYHWVTSDGYLAHKKTIWDRAKKMGEKENQYALSRGYTKIPSKAKRRFLYWLRK